MRANVGRPVTRIRHEILMPRWEVLDRGRFKVLPNTPSATKSPGWKLGSGFDGITLKQSTNMSLQASRKRKFGHTRTPQIVGHSLPELDFSAGSSPTRHFIGQRGIPSRQKKHYGPEPVEKLCTADDALEGGPAQSAAKTCEEAASRQVATSTTPIQSLMRNDRSGTSSSSHHGILKGPTQLHPSQSRDLDASQTIREPSRSERNGWLKRRKVDLAVADEDEERLFARILTARVHGIRERKGSGRDRVDGYLKDTTQTQHDAGADQQAFSRGGQTTQNPHRPVSSQRQKSIQKEPSARPRRRRVSQDVEAESSDSEGAASTHQRLNRPPHPPPSLESEADLPASAFHPPPGLSMPKARSSIQGSRTSEIPETQEEVLREESTALDAPRTERLNPDDRRHHPFDETTTTLGSGGYFSAAVRQLGSAETVPHTITRRRSRREPDRDARGLPLTSRMWRRVSSHQVNAAPFVVEESGPQKQEGVLQLGVTPRLKGKMSNVPFRPPFMESL